MYNYLCAELVKISTNLSIHLRSLKTNLIPNIHSSAYLVLNHKHSTDPFYIFFRIYRYFYFLRTLSGTF